jgi:hypothetical protein
LRCMSNVFSPHRDVNLLTTTHRHQPWKPCCPGPPTSAAAPLAMEGPTSSVYAKASRSKPRPSARSQRSALTERILVPLASGQSPAAPPVSTMLPLHPIV